MGTEIEIELDGERFRAKLSENETAEKIADALPVRAVPRFWGDEIYFELPVDIAENELPETELNVGDLAYWPEGKAFCIFFGPTPSSKASEPRPASPVTIIGELLDDPGLLQDIDRSSVGKVKIKRL